MNQWNGFFINRYSVIHFIFSDHFPFLVVLNKRKNKSMGTCILKIIKDHFFACEEKMKNDIPFFKGKARPFLEMCARGKTYTALQTRLTFQNQVYKGPP